MREAFHTGAAQRPRGPSAFLHAALSERDATRPLVITLPAPVAHGVVALWDEASDAVLFAPPGDGAMAGIGAAFTIAGRGASRFADVEEQARAFFDRLLLATHAAVDRAPEPRFVGGMAFAPGGAVGAPWDGSGERFGDGRFVLPRWTYRIHGQQASLQLCLAEGDTTRGALEEHERLRSRLSHARTADERVVPRGMIEEPPERFEARVRRITERIGSGEAQKIVAARRVEVRLEGRASARPLLERFAQRHRSCTRFAMRIAGTTFLGATPERLVAVSDGRVRTEALAGTAPRGDREALEASLKDAAEHAFVAEAIASALEPFVEAVERPREPQVRVLPDVLHLQTPIEGTLRGDAHVLEIAAALHPTPAVGGVPREAAIAHILAHEPPRGWYTGPFGVFDRRGEGDFVVALRSGVLRGDRAWAWAGGGIVRDSSPAAELEETRLKLRPFLGVLDG